MQYDQEFEKAERALLAAHAAVYSLDISAGKHAYEFGLKKVSHDTGGIYERTDLFPEAAMNRVERILSGYYVLTIRKAVPGTGRHEVEVTLLGRKGTVLHRRFYDD